MLKFNSKEPYYKGQIIIDTETLEEYEVQSCVNMEWLTQGDKKDYIVIIEEIK